MPQERTDVIKTTLSRKTRSANRRRRRGGGGLDPLQFMLQAPSPEAVRPEPEAGRPSRLPSHVKKVIRSPGRSLNSDARNLLKMKTSVDPSKLRIHSGAAANRSASSLNARAYTVGRHIVFASGYYTPRTRRGRHLLAHEAAHAARNRPIAVLRSSFDSEDPAMRIRRRAAILKARTIFRRLLGALSRGYIWRHEEIRRSGIYLLHMDEIEAIANRASRLRGIVRAMILMVRELETAPIPQDWLAASVSGTAGSLTAGAPDQAMTDVLMFYSHRARQRGLNLDLIHNNLAYIMSTPIPSRAVTPALRSHGIPTGINIHVPDPVNEPLVYRRVTGFERLRPVGVIVEVIHDSFGYYYMYRSRQHYLPERP